MDGFIYAGGELELFAEAHRWKRYWRRQVAPWLAGDVLEVGAGLGSNTSLLADVPCRSWVCLEPDRQFAARLAQPGMAGSRAIEVLCATVPELAPDRCFDTILYVDVLEHIADDRAELAAAARHLRPGGTIVVVSPALPMLFSSFDRQVGHHRRYTRAALRALTPAGCRVARLYYLDAVGMAASLANRLLLRQALPTARQLAFWDRYLVTLSRVVDPLLLHIIGKTVVGVWRQAG